MKRIFSWPVAHKNLQRPRVLWLRALPLALILLLAFTSLTSPVFANATSHTIPEARSVPGYQMGIQVRVGSRNCAGFNGTLQWGGNGSLLIPAYMNLDGTLWDNCGGTTYLYLSYTHCTSPHDDQLSPSAAPYRSVQIHAKYESRFCTYGSILVDACQRLNGWRCGKPQGPN